jgi:hypothetical protein
MSKVYCTETAEMTERKPYDGGSRNSRTQAIANYTNPNKGKAIPSQAVRGPGGSRRLRLPDF